MSNIENRRYKVEGDRIMKVWDGRDDDGWFASKADAIAWASPKSATIPAAISAPLDWNRKWMAVKSDLRALGFTGDTKAEAIEWAHENDVECPS